MYCTDADTICRSEVEKDSRYDGYPYNICCLTSGYEFERAEPCECPPRRASAPATTPSLPPHPPSHNVDIYTYHSLAFDDEYPNAPAPVHAGTGSPATGRPVFRTASASSSRSLLLSTLPTHRISHNITMYT